MDRADRWLHRELSVIRSRRDDFADDAVVESLDSARAGLDALEAAGAVSAATASIWRVALAREATGGRPAVATAELGGRARRHLAELLEALGPEPHMDDPGVVRFQAAADLFSALGAVDGRGWDARLRERTGRPSADEEHAETRALNAGGTQVELLDVIPGPADARRGHRLLLVLRFADDVSFLIDRTGTQTPDEGWPEWELADDLGNAYDPSFAGGGSAFMHISFYAPIASRASWIQLTLADQADVSFRVTVD
jgi:hypothetical protein